MFLVSSATLWLLLLLTVSLPFGRTLGGRPPPGPDDDTADDDDDDFTMLIAGGYRPRKHSFAKYMVSIRTAKPTAYFGDNHFCAGTIIASRLIVTAAHCIMDSNQIVTRPRRLVVVAGTPNRLRKSKDTLEMAVESVIPHEKFIRRGRNDIAVLRLKTTLPEDNDQIKVIPLADAKPRPGQNCTVVGWGQLFYNGPYTAMAVYVNLMIFPDNICRQRYSHNYAEGMICAGDSADWEKDACRGDSGGPMICDKKLTGIVSWGVRCGSPGFPGAYTGIFYHRSWLESVNGAEGRRPLSVVWIFLVPVNWRSWWLGL